MKKLISLAVVVVLLLSFTTTTFAATIDDFVEKAAGEVGTTYHMDLTRDEYYVQEEVKYGQWFNSQRFFLTRPFKAEYDLHKAPWCVMFVSWCSNQVGLGIPAHSNVTRLKNWYSSQGRYHDWQSYSPKKGDTVFFMRNGEDSHVGIIESVENLPDIPYRTGKWIKMTVIEGDCIYWVNGQEICTVDRVSREIRTSQFGTWNIYSNGNVIVGFGEN